MSLHTLGGMKGSVHHCPDCKRKTPHLAAPGGSPVCTRCGFVQPIGGRR
jgi:hypothetical protein